MDMKNRSGMRRLLFLLLLLAAVAASSACSGRSTAENRKMKIGVTVYDQYDTFISELMNHFQDDAGEHKDRVTLEIVNAAKSQQTQNKQVEDMIRDGCDVICVNLVDRTAPAKIIESAKKNNVPIIFFNRELVEEDLYRWDHLYYVGADAFQSGILQGQVAAERCLSDPSIDRNGDGSIQYIILEGEAGHQDAIVRSEYCVNTMIDMGVQLEKLGYALANWNRTQAQTKAAQMISQYGDDIELILANNDDMALGAIDAYKEAKIPQKRWPLIVGIDGTRTGLAAVREKEMAGTVYNDQRGQADAMFALAFAIGAGESLDDLGLEDGKYIRLPYEIITAENVEEYEKRR